MALDSPDYDNLPTQLDDGEINAWDLDSSAKFVSTGPGYLLGICDSHENYCQSVHLDSPLL